MLTGKAKNTRGDKEEVGVGQEEEEQASGSVIAGQLAYLEALKEHTQGTVIIYSC